MHRGACNNATIVANIISAEGNNYTSRLSVTPIPETAERTVDCFSDNGTYTTLLFSSVIPTPGTYVYMYS